MGVCLRKHHDDVPHVKAQDCGAETGGSSQVQTNLIDRQQTDTNGRPESYRQLLHLTFDRTTVMVPLLIGVTARARATANALPVLDCAGDSGLNCWSRSLGKCLVDTARDIRSMSTSTLRAT